MSLIQPFENEFKSVSLDGLTIENRTTHIGVYGAIALTRDKAGLANARELRDLMVDIVRVLESDATLPDHIVSKPTTTVKNPFK